MKRMALVSLLVCIGLVPVWWLMSGRTAAPSREGLPAWVAGLGEAGASLVEVRARGEVVRFEQTAPGTWLWRGADGATWPAQPERVRGALRLLAEAVPTEGGGEGSHLDGAAEVYITIDGAVRRLRVGTQALGGMTPIEVEGEPGRMLSAHGQAGLAPVFEPASLSAWRADRALASGQTEPDVLRVRAGEEVLSLTRARGRWTVSAPVMAEAESEVVQRALAGLMDVEIVRFVPKEDAEPGVTQTPSVVVVVESESRRLEGSEVVSRTLVQELRLGVPIGGGGATHLARIHAEWVDAGTGVRTPAWGPAYAAVTTRAVPIPTRVEAVISRVAWSLAAADVRELWVCAAGAEGETVATFSRGIEGWARRGGEGARSEVASGAAAVAKLLSEARAERVQVEAPEGVEWLAVVHAAVGGTSVRQAEIGVMEVGGPRVVVRAGGVSRVYAAGAAVGVPEWLRGVVAARR